MSKAKSVLEAVCCSANVQQALHWTFSKFTIRKVSEPAHASGEGISLQFGRHDHYVVYYRHWRLTVNQC